MPGVLDSTTEEEGVQEQDDAWRENDYSRKLEAARAASRREREEMDEQNQPRPSLGSRVQRGLRTTSNLGNAAGKTAQGVGKAGEFAAEGAEQLSKGAKQAGKGMMQAGSRLSSTGYGAIAGVPTAIAGGALYGAGEAGELASKGGKAVARGVQKGGNALSNISSRISSKSSTLGSIAESAETATELAKATTSPTQLTQLAFKREIQQAKQAALQAATGDVGAAIDTVANTTTGAILKWSWIIAIPTFGLSLLYIAFHFVARYIYGSQRFCRFGEEWGLKVPMLGGDKLAQAVTPFNSGLELVECLGMFVGLAIFGAIVFLFLGVWNVLICIANNPTQVLTGTISCQ